MNYEYFMESGIWGFGVIVAFIIGVIGCFQGVATSEEALARSGGGFSGKTIKEILDAGKEIAMRPLKVSLFTSIPLVLLSVVSLFTKKE